MKLSLCIATFNEAGNLHYPLDSAIDLVDEVVIVDGGSTDGTVEVAKKYGRKVKVFVTDNPPMFHINKQKAIEKARGEWILQLDADEAVSPELREEINSVISQGQTPPLAGLVATSSTDSTLPVAYWLPRKNFFLTRFLTHGGQYPDYTIRLYRRGVAHFPCKSVHENVTIDPSMVILSDDRREEPKDPRKDRTNNEISRQARDDREYIGYLKSPLLHYSDPEFKRYLTRWNRYTTLDARLLLEKGERPGFISYFFLKPSHWFFSTYFRHKGFMDGTPGFIFSLFSSIRFWAIYAKWWQKTR